MHYCHLSIVSPLSGLRSNREEPPAVCGSLTPDHGSRIIAERVRARGVRLCPRMHRSCAYYSYPYKSHANIPQSRNSLSCVCLKSPTSETHYARRTYTWCRVKRSEARDKILIGARRRVHDSSVAFSCCSRCRLSHVHSLFL